MSDCPHEPEVVRATMRGTLDREPALQAHVDVCADCRETRRVAEWMRTYASGAAVDCPQLPESGHLFWKARLLQRWEDEQRAAAPIERMQRIELIGALLGLIAFAMWQWPALTTLVTPAPERLSSLAVAAAPVGIGPLVIGAGVLLVITTLIVMRTLDYED